MQRATISVKEASCRGLYRSDRRAGRCNESALRRNVQANWGCAECKRKPLWLRSKLAVNQPGDQYEKGAGRVPVAVVSPADCEPYVD